jgi:hypothetical protein
MLAAGHCPPVGGTVATAGAPPGPIRRSSRWASSLRTRARTAMPQGAPRTCRRSGSSTANRGEHRTHPGESGQDLAGPRLRRPRSVLASRQGTCGPLGARTGNGSAPTASNPREVQLGVHRRRRRHRVRPRSGLPWRQPRLQAGPVPSLVETREDRSTRSCPTERFSQRASSAVVAAAVTTGAANGIRARSPTRTCGTRGWAFLERSGWRSDGSSDEPRRGGRCAKDDAA